MFHRCLLIIALLGCSCGRIDFDGLHQSVLPDEPDIPPDVEECLERLETNDLIAAIADFGNAAPCQTIFTLDGTGSSPGKCGTKIVKYAWTIRSEQGVVFTTFDGAPGAAANGRSAVDGTSERWRAQFAPYNGALAARVKIGAPSENMQFYYTYMSLEENAWYVLNFDGYSEQGKRTSAYVQKHGGDFNTYGLSGFPILLTDSWQAFSVEFATPQNLDADSTSVKDGRLRFRFNGFAADGDIYWFDNFTLHKKDDPNKTNLLTNPDFEASESNWRVSGVQWMAAPVSNRVSGTYRATLIVTDDAGRISAEAQRMFTLPSCSL